MTKFLKPIEFWTSDYWLHTGLKPWFGLIFILIFSISFSLFYYFKIKNKKCTDTPEGFVLLVEMCLLWIQNLVIRSLGKKYKKISSYIFFLIFYINVGNLAAILGLATPLSNVSIVLSLGFITFLGIFVFGFIFKKIGFFLVLLNPLDLISMITAFISISFRLFGNLLAGSIILGLLYFFSSKNNFTNLNPLTFILIAPLHFYFDFFSGVLHSIIFAILTLTYWSMHKPISDELK